MCSNVLTNEFHMSQIIISTIFGTDCFNSADVPLSNQQDDS